MYRPASVIIFGILNVLFGLMGLCGTGLVAVTQYVGGQPNPVFEIAKDASIFGAWLMASTVLGIIASVVLLVAGIGLLAGRSWARVASVWYSYYAIVMSLVGLIFNMVFVFPQLFAAFQQVEGPEAVGVVGGIVGGIVGGVVGLAYPILMLYFLTRPHVIASFDADRPADHIEPEMIGTHDQVAAATWEAEPVESTDNPYRSPRAPAQAMSLPGAPAQQDALSTLIPYRNAPALVSYYLGVFSLLACIPIIGLIGVAMAVAAVVYGIKGLRRAADHPEARGRVHAWVGLVGGTVCGLFGLVLQIMIAVSILTSW